MDIEETARTGATECGGEMPGVVGSAETGSPSLGTLTSDPFGKLLLTQ